MATIDDSHALDIPHDPSAPTPPVPPGAHDPELAPDPNEPPIATPSRVDDPPKTKRPPRKAPAPAPHDHLIASIRAACAPGASDDARASGANACRALETVLRSRAGQPLAATLPGPPGPAVTAPASPFAVIAGMLPQLVNMLPQLAAMPREQIIDTLRQLAGVIPRNATPTAAAPRFHLIDIPQVPPRRPGGGS